MDIIDIMLAKAMTPQGKTDAYVAKANKAAAKAAKAEQDAAAAIATVEAAADEIATAKSEASDLLKDAQDALETAQAAQINLPESYSTTGQNTDGYMTQKATTDALALKADASALAAKADASALTGKMDAFNLNDYATKSYVTSQLANLPSGGNTSINVGANNAGHLVTIDTDGSLIASTLTDEALRNALTNSSSYNYYGTIGLDMDYANRTFVRIQDALGKTMGQDFDMYAMYGGRTRCNVADDGTINAFYGETGYIEDGSNGQVMVYQPKFYYKRVILNSELSANGRVVRHEALVLSDTERAGFKLAPIFGDNLDYVLLPAYDGSISNNKLSSVANVYPVTNITITDAEAAANARGTGWHIMSLEAEISNQMLEIIEFGSMNGQMALGEGITYAVQNAINCLYKTGSTSSLGNGSGQAVSTTVSANGNVSTLSDNGYRAISYRGMENPWGNLWSMIGNVNVTGTGLDNGGKIYFCSNYNYTPGINGSNYNALDFNLSNSYGWINAMGYDEDHDWAYIPIETSNSATSLAPVGDTVWPTNNLNGIVTLVIGGSFGFKEECGPFQYGADRAINDTSRANYGAKLLYIPTKNETYTANIAKWNTYMGG